MRALFYIGDNPEEQVIDCVDFVNMVDPFVLVSTTDGDGFKVEYYIPFYRILSFKLEY